MGVRSVNVKVQEGEYYVITRDLGEKELGEELGGIRDLGRNKEARAQCGGEDPALGQVRTEPLVCRGGHKPMG